MPKANNSQQSSLAADDTDASGSPPSGRYPASKARSTSDVVDGEDPMPAIRRIAILNEVTAEATRNEREIALDRFETQKSVTLWTPRFGLRTVHCLRHWDLIQAGRDPMRED